MLNSARLGHAEPDFLYGLVKHTDEIAGSKCGGTEAPLPKPEGGHGPHGNLGVKRLPVFFERLPCGFGNEGIGEDPLSNWAA